jgi:hypothetical protein
MIAAQNFPFCAPEILYEAYLHSENLHMQFILTLPSYTESQSIGDTGVSPGLAQTKGS